MSEIEDRRQRAREAFYDEAVLPEGEDGAAIESAIEVATRVKITAEVIEQIMCNTGTEWGGEVRDIIEEFCSALGFEVID